MALVGEDLPAVRRGSDDTLDRGLYLVPEASATRVLRGWPSFRGAPEISPVVGRLVKILNHQGKKYRQVVLQVVESDGRGPRTFRILRDDESTDVQDDMAFWVVWASEDVLNAPKPN